MRIKSSVPFLWLLPMVLGRRVIRRLRIAVLNRSFDPSGGGAERYSVALVEHLAARHEIHVFAQDIAHQWPGVIYHRISTPLKKPRWVNQLWFATATWQATRGRFDVVHSHENTWHGNVQTVHVLPVWHNLFHGRTGVQRLLRWIKVITSPRLLAYLGLENRRFAVPAAGVNGPVQRQIMVTSNSLRQVMVETFPHSAPFLQVLVPGVALPPSETSLSQRQAARTALGLPQDVPCVLLVGNDYRKKGLQCLLEALHVLSSRESTSHAAKDAIVAVVGHTHQQPEFLAVAKSLRLEKRVFFLGSLSDVTPAYQAATVLAHPTLEDTFAMVVLEAMSHGLPVVVSGPDYCGIAGMLSDGENALLLSNPYDAAALVNALEKVLSSQTLTASLGAAARQFAMKHTWAEKALVQESIYTGLAASP